MTVYKIGSTLGSIADLNELSTPVPYPLQSFKPYARIIGTGSGGAIGLGWATDEWSWGFLTASQRNVLKGFCPNASSDVYIQTFNDSIATPAWKVYRSKMIWSISPDGEDRQSGRRIKHTIIFRLIEDVTT